MTKHELVDEFGFDPSSLHAQALVGHAHIENSFVEPVWWPVDKERYCGVERGEMGRGAGRPDHLELHKNKKDGEREREKNLQSQMSEADKLGFFQDGQRLLFLDRDGIVVLVHAK